MPVRDESSLQTIEEREALLAEAEQIAHVGSWVWHIADNSVYWSDELFRILGLDRETHSASTEAFFGAIHPEDLPALQEESAKIAETGSGVPRTVRIVRPDGEVRAIRMTSKQITSEDGAPLRMVGTLIDITDSLAQELEVKLALERMQAAQRIAGVGSWAWNIETNAVEWSQQMYRIAGKDPEEFEPTVEQFFEFVHPEDVPVMRGAMEAGIGGAPLAAECRLVLDDGEVRHVYFESQIAGYAGDDPAQLHGTMLDITERKNLEAQLRQSQKMEALGQLAGGVAHDLNNYLQIIAGNVELLERDDEDRAEESAQARSDIRTSLQLCSSLTKGLLAFGRRQRAKPRPVELHGAIERSASRVGKLPPWSASCWARTSRRNSSSVPSPPRCCATRIKSSK
jgi:PAS domain S-box-containing protein